MNGHGGETTVFETPFADAPITKKRPALIRREDFFSNYG
jgi:hypothetical protein